MDMELDTVMLAIGHEDDDVLPELARTAIQVAEPAGATVVSVHVFTQNQFSDLASELDFPGATAEDIDEIVERHESVRYLEETVEDHSVDYATRGVVGDVSDALLSTADEIGADRLVIAGTTKTPVGKAIFGSTAQNVLLDAPCPVTYVKPDED
jgi:nucleotide-binding universal stress UspA family protein